MFSFGTPTICGIRRAYRWHNHLTFESPPYSVIDSFWFPPIRGNAFESVGLMSSPFLGMLLDDRYVLFRGDHLSIVSLPLESAATWLALTLMEESVKPTQSNDLGESAKLIVLAVLALYVIFRMPRFALALCANTTKLNRAYEAVT